MAAYRECTKQSRARCTVTNAARQLPPAAPPGSAECVGSAPAHAVPVLDPCRRDHPLAAPALQRNRVAWQRTLARTRTGRSVDRVLRVPILPHHRARMYTFSFPPFFLFYGSRWQKCDCTQHSWRILNQGFLLLFLSRGISSNWDRNEIIVTVTTDEC